MEECVPHYRSTKPLKHHFTELPAPTPDSFMVDLERHLRGLAVTQPPKKRVRFTLQPQRISDAGGDHEPRLPTILLARIRDPDGSKPAGRQNLSRSPSPGVSSLPKRSALRASTPYLSTPYPPPGSWRRRFDPVADAEYTPSPPTSYNNSSTDAYLGVPLVEMLELRDEAWTLLSARPCDDEAVDDDTMREC